MKSSVMDAPATDEERAQFEQTQAETRYIQNSWDNEIARAKGEDFISYVPEADDGTEQGYTTTQGPQDYAPAGDDVPRSLDQVTDGQSFAQYASQYLPPDVTGPLSADEVQTVREGVDLAKFEYRQEQANKNLFACEKQARARHPRDYDLYVDNYVAPLINQDPRVFEMLRYLPDPAEAAYKLAHIVANGGQLPSTPHRRLNSLSQKDIDRMDAETFTEHLRAIKEGPDESEFDHSEVINREKMKRMNKLGFRDFENELDRFKREG